MVKIPITAADSRNVTHGTIAKGIALTVSFRGKLFTSSIVPSGESFRDIYLHKEEKMCEWFADAFVVRTDTSMMHTHLDKPQLFSNWTASKGTRADYDLSRTPHTLYFRLFTFTQISSKRNAANDAGTKIAEDHIGEASQIGFAEVIIDY